VGVCARRRRALTVTVNKSFHGTAEFQTLALRKIETRALRSSLDERHRFMSDGSIGIQVIIPKTGTSPQSRPQQQANDREADNAPPAKQAPPPPGMGKLVDKTV
jgi:hypothetical protein